MNKNTSDDIMEREPARFALLVAGIIARRAAGDVPDPDESEAVFQARMHGLFDGKEPALLDAYFTLVNELMRRISDLSSPADAIDFARGLTAQVIQGDPTLSVTDAGRNRSETVRDIRLAVAGTARVLLDDGSDEDLAVLQRHSADAMLPEAFTLLCFALERTGEPAAVLDEYTRSVLVESLQGE